MVQASTLRKTLCELSRATTHSLPAQVIIIRPSQIIPLPISPVYLPVRERVKQLNAAISAWGFHDDPRAFARAFAADLVRADTDSETFARWVREKEDWVVRGDDILNALQEFLSIGFIENLPLSSACSMWSDITQVAFKVQFAMATVEARLDLRGNHTDVQK
ncbi:hypothetical protein LXA43DRAFT_904797 [Ganoderma leucocontextum]|nr:hypothetical protein LXA43DRAFT_904797 [Ganoderma leucocontextum]